MEKEHRGAAGHCSGTVPKSYWECAIPQCLSVPVCLSQSSTPFGQAGYPEETGRSRPNAHNSVVMRHTVQN